MDDVIELDVSPVLGTVCLREVVLSILILD